MKDATIGFIGGGNMASSLIGGLLADGVPAGRLQVSDRDDGRREQLRENFGIEVREDNEALVGSSDVVVLAVKPQSLRAVCEAIAPAVARRKPLMVSVAAGVRSGAITDWLGGRAAVVRAMPNTPALVQSGATALFANTAVTSTQREMAEGILRAAGLTLWLEDETLMDTVTALSGSGPAYFFLVMEMLEKAGTELGLPAETARLLTLQTAYGAAKMAFESSDDPATLRARVTSPGGTTERAIGVLHDGDVEALFARAVAAARERSQELADMLESQ